MIKIDVYTLPNCGGCLKLKEALTGTDLEDITEFKGVKGKENKENLHFIKAQGITDIPAVHIYNDSKERFLIGYHPVEEIRKIIKQIQEV